MQQNREYIEKAKLELPNKLLDTTGPSKGYNSELFSEMEKTFQNSFPRGGRQF
ncbi:UNVERIFIED_CONTAM: hypothetical protein O8I53_11605 [Campylobacter lari]